MIKRFASLIRLIVGRVRKNMTASIMTLGSLCIPLAFYLLFTSLDKLKGMWLITSFIASFGILLVGVICLHFALKWARDDEAKNLKIYKALYDAIKEETREIKGLRQDLGGKNGGNDKPKQ